MDALKFPLEFYNGSLRKLTDGSDAYYAQILALAIQINPGELPLTPTYGVEDPTFQPFLTRDLAYTAGAFVPEIIINNALLEQSPDGRVEINISFAQRNQQ